MMDEIGEEIGNVLIDIAGSGMKLAGEIAIGSAEVLTVGLVEGLTFGATMAGEFLSGASEIAVTSISDGASAVTEIFTGL